MKSSNNKTKKSPRKIKFFWKKSQRPTNDSAILINGKTVVFIACSIISGFINLVFITNLTKSAYPIGTLLSVPAAVLLGIMSIGLDLSKCLHSIQVNTLNELYRKLSDRPWAKRIKHVANKWFAIYLLYVILSVITSMSLSSISIGAGVSRKAQYINMISKDISKLQGLDKEIDAMNNNLDKDDLTQMQKGFDINEEIESTFSQVVPILQEYRQIRAEFDSQFGQNGVNSSEPITFKGEYIENPSKWWDDKNNAYRSRLKTYIGDISNNDLKNISEDDLKLRIKNKKENFNKNSAAETIQNKVEEKRLRVQQEIEGLEGKYKHPDTEEIIVFDANNLSATISKLEVLKVEYENNTGDIGMSSKLFLQGASWIDSIKNKHKNTDLQSVTESNEVVSLGTAEILMMAMLLFLSLLCELAINQFSPKTAISRKMLSQFSQYFPAGFDVNDFMLEVLIEQYNYGEITKAQFDKEVNETLAMMKTTKQGLLDKLHKTETTKKSRVIEKPEVKTVVKEVVKEVPAEINNPKIDGLVNEIEDLIATEKAS